MSDSARRAVCRLTFLLFCVGPTLLVLYWMVRPFPYQSLTSNLENRFAAKVNIRGVSYPKPGICQIDSVLISPSGVSAKPWIIRDVATFQRNDEIRVDGMPQPVTFETLADVLSNGLTQLQSQSRAESTTIRFDQLPITIFSKDANPALTESNANTGTVTLLQPRLHAQTDGNRSLASLEFKLAANDSAASFFQIEKNSRATSGQVLEDWSFNTGKARFPMSLLQSMLPDIQIFGNSATFSGTVTSKTVVDGETIVSISGELQTIDLKTFVEIPCNAAINGTARIQNLECKIVNGKVHRISGDFSSENINAALHFSYALRNLGFDLQSIHPELLRQIRSLAFHFDIQDNHISIYSLYKEGPNGQVLAFDEAGATLIKFPRGNPVKKPLTQAIRELVASPSYDVPLTPQTIELFRNLLPQNK